MRSVHETHLSAICRPAQANPRLSCQDAHPVRPRRDQCAAGQGPGSACGLILPARLYSFPKSARLRNSAEFRAVLGRRAGVSGRYFQVFSCLNSLSGARLGVVAGRKAAGISVRRNVARRLIRETFRLMRVRLTGADFVVRVVRPVSRSDELVARQELNELLIKASGRCRAC
jgi:ribonuclease P protein component